MDQNSEEKNKRISRELTRINKYFKEVASNQRAVITPLLQNAAFMKVTLEDLQEIVNREGVTDEYQNGANQKGVKQSATLQSYNALIKNYANVIKTLFSLLPSERKKNILEPFKWEPPEQTEEEWEEQMRQEDERRRKIDEEIERAAEYQRQQRELEKQKSS